MRPFEHTQRCGIAIDKAEWLAMRRKGIGGSDSASVLDESKYTSRHDLWLDKTGQSIPWDGNAITRLGNYLEEHIIAKHYRGRAILGDSMGSFMMRDRPYMRANFDAMLEDDELLIEIKTTDKRGWKRGAWRNGMPHYYWTQCQHYMGVLGFARAELALCVLDGDRETLCRAIESCGASARDVVETFGDQIEVFDLELDWTWWYDYLDACEAFWACVESGVYKEAK